MLNSFISGLKFYPQRLGNSMHILVSATRQADHNCCGLIQRRSQFQYMSNGMRRFQSRNNTLFKGQGGETFQGFRIGNLNILSAP